VDRCGKIVASSTLFLEYQFIPHGAGLEDVVVSNSNGGKNVGRFIVRFKSSEFAQLLTLDCKGVLEKFYTQNNLGSSKDPNGSGWTCCSNVIGQPEDTFSRLPMIISKGSKLRR